MGRKLLLACGVISSLLYLGMNIYIPMLAPGYHVTSQTVSELSAIGAPTRGIWVAFAAIYGVLLLAFGAGILASARHNRLLRLAGIFLLAQGILGFFWPPMHLRGTPPTLTDTLHIVFTFAWLALMLMTIVFAAAALGGWFRPYSVVTLVVFLGFGTLTALEGGRIARNLPTPWIGTWERINIAAAMLWLAILAITLLRAGKEQRSERNVRMRRAPGATPLGLAR